MFCELQKLLSVNQSYHGTQHLYDTSYSRRHAAAETALPLLQQSRHGQQLNFVELLPRNQLLPYRLGLTFLKITCFTLQASCLVLAFLHRVHFALVHEKMSWMFVTNYYVILNSYFPIIAPTMLKINVIETPTSQFQN